MTARPTREKVVAFAGKQGDDPLLMNVPVYDYGRSFLQFTTDHSHHTPRMQLEASCWLSGAGEGVEYFLTSDCISERMYSPSGLIHQPASLFSLIAGNDGRFLMRKRHASAGNDIEEAHRVGEKMSSHDGKGATMLKIAIEARAAPNPRRLREYGEIREAILQNRPLIGRTTYESAGGKSKVQLGYPIKTCNIAHGIEAWQIDTGPILFPAFPIADRIDLACLRPAFIVFNTWNWAELAVQTAVALDSSQARTTHFSEIVRLEGVANELFSAE